MYFLPEYLQNNIWTKQCSPKVTPNSHMCWIAVLWEIKTEQEENEVFPSFPASQKVRKSSSSKTE